MDEERAKKPAWFGLSRNVIAMGAVSFLNDLSSEMIFPFIPIFLTSVLGTSISFVGLVEGFADATASVVKIISGRYSDIIKRRKPFVVFGYGLSAIAKPFLSFATAPWHVLGVRFVDRVGKGTRDAPRDALISLSCQKKDVGRAFGFHRGADTLGAAAGPLLAFFILPAIHNNLRTLFLFSFFASACAVFILTIFVREVFGQTQKSEHARFSADRNMLPQNTKFRISSLGMPFLIFLAASTVFSLGRASDAFLLLRAQSVGVALVLIPIIYFSYNITYALLSTPAGILSDRIGHRNTFMIGMAIFSLTYLLFAQVTSSTTIWFVFVIYGFFGAFTEGVGRAIVADLVKEEWRGSAYGVYNACTGLALLPGSVIFGVLWDMRGPAASFQYGAALGSMALIIFLFLRITNRRAQSVSL